MNAPAYLAPVLLPALTVLGRWAACFLMWAVCIGLAAQLRPALAADRIEVRNVTFESAEDHWQLDAEFKLELTPRLEEALHRGLPLYFLIEFEVNRPRWYWFDDKAIAATLNYRLSFNALTRQYRLSTGSLQQGFATLAEALGVMTRLRHWRVAERGALRAGETYQAALRMRLDVSQLPKPFQINAVTDRDWTLESDWKRFALTTEPAR